MGSAERSPDRQRLVPLATIERCEEEAVRLVAVRGELDISNVGALEDATLDLANEALGMVLDLSGATYIDSSTLGLLFKLQRSLQRRGQALRVVCAPGSSARRVLELTGFAHELTCAADREAAIAAIRREVPLCD
ncbi:MAG TPA: STAS domain-containing protein [Solirubrobacteraceae bacterium]|nr:STAS domain-containing protein [Solirubrobacteraceae bacterium]